MARQEKIRGTQEKTIAELDKAAEAYVEARDERMALTEREVTKRQKLEELMRTHKKTLYRNEVTKRQKLEELMRMHKKTLYRNDELIVELTTAEKARVRKVHAPAEEE